MVQDGVMTTVPSPVPNPSIDARAPEISRAIYGMPMFVNLSARDIAATTSWYTDGLGFIVLFSAPGPDGTPLSPICVAGSSRTCSSIRRLIRWRAGRR
jgi:hypothetical protein